MKYRNLKYSYNVTGLAIIMFLAIREVAAFAVNQLPVEKGSVAAISISIVSFVISCIVPAIVMENMLGLHPKLFKKASAAQVGAAGVYSYLLILGTGVVNSLLLAALAMAGLDFAPQTLSIPDGTASVILYFVYVCILPPLLEEIFVRGYILNLFRPLGTTFAVVVSSVCFSLMHSSLENFLLYFVCGIILARVYITFDSIFASMFVHFLNNTMSFFILYFQQRVNAVSALSMIAYINIFVVIIGVVGKRYLDKKGFSWKKIFFRDSELTAKLGYISKSPVAVTAFAMLLFFAAFQSYHNLV